MVVGAVAVRHEPASAALVRQAIAADLAAHGVARDCIDDVMLVASELVGNAALHAAGTSGDDPDLAISWDIGPEQVTVLVADPSTELPLPRDSADSATSGRGLAIVAALSTAWGTEPTAHGKQVWASIRIVAV